VGKWDEAEQYCLRESCEFKKRFLESVITTSGTLPKDLDQLEVETQVAFKASQDSDPNAGRFDLVIQSAPDRFVLVLENKVASDFRKNQISDYQHELNEGRQFQGYKAFLAALTKHSVPREYEDKLVACLLWSRVEKMLREVSRSTTLAKNPAVAAILGQFADFLKSKGMYFMEFPKIADDQLFKDGISFCHSIQQILISATADLSEVRGSTVRIKEWKGDKLWIEIGSNLLYLGFQIKPAYSLCVEANAEFSKKLPEESQMRDSSDNMEFNSWGNGFGFYGKFTEEMKGNAAKVQAWFEQAARKAITMRKDYGAS
jgi:hypothetical protein